MATSPKNRITRTLAVNSVFPDAKKVIDATVSYNQGDLLVFDDTANLLKVPALETEASTFLGIAVSTVVLGKPVSPYLGTAVDAAQAITDVPGPHYGVIAKLKSKVGDAWNPGDRAFLSPADDAQTVSSAGTKSIGIYVGGVVAAAVAGDQVEIHLGHRHPNDVLVMP